MTGQTEQAACQPLSVEQSPEQLATASGDGREHLYPMGLGYLQRELLPADELDDARNSVKKVALAEGFVIGAIYVERAETAPAAFEALIDAIGRHEIKAVIVPSLLHFVELAAANNIKGAFERATGARVIVARCP